LLLAPRRAGKTRATSMPGRMYGVSNAASGPGGRSLKGRGGGQASASLPLLDDDTASPASPRLASARPALAPKWTCYYVTDPNLGTQRLEETQMYRPSGCSDHQGSLQGLIEAMPNRQTATVCVINLQNCRLPKFYPRGIRENCFPDMRINMHASMGRTADLRCSNAMQKL
jgi:hypothetical protein